MLLGLNRFHCHKLRHSFQDCISPICDFGLQIKTATCISLHCFLLQSARQSSLMNRKKIDETILKKHEKLNVKKLLYDSDKFNLSCNKSTIFSSF